MPVLPLALAQTSDFLTTVGKWHILYAKSEEKLFCNEKMLRESRLSMDEIGQDQQSLEKINVPIEENSAKLKKLGSIKAECVGRIVVAPDLVPNIIDALQTGLESYTAQKKLLVAKPAVKFSDPIDQMAWEAYKVIEPLYSDANRRLAQ